MPVRFTSLTRTRTPERAGTADLKVWRAQRTAPALTPIGHAFLILRIEMQRRGPLGRRQEQAPAEGVRDDGCGLCFRP
jgi:hypothetical protein